MRIARMARDSGGGVALPPVLLRAFDASKKRNLYRN
jgi:hypothetical protein